VVEYAKIVLAVTNVRRRCPQLLTHIAGFLEYAAHLAAEYVLCQSAISVEGFLNCKYFKVSL